jgi:hypothetical protein
MAKKVPLAWTFCGKLLLPTSKGLQPSSIAITARAPANAVSGLPAVAGFPVPTVHVGAGYSDDLRVDYQTTLGRPLRLVATVTGKNADGSIAVSYRLDEPPILREADLRRYLSTPSLGHPYYVLRVTLASGKTEPLVLDQEIGRVGTLDNAAISTVSLAPSRFIQAGSTTVTLSPAAFQTTARGTTGALVEELLAAPITCVYDAGGLRTPCSLSYVETRFATP